MEGVTFYLWLHLCSPLTFEYRVNGLATVIALRTHWNKSRVKMPSGFHAVYWLQLCLSLHITTIAPFHVTAVSPANLPLVSNYTNVLLIQHTLLPLKHRA